LRNDHAMPQLGSQAPLLTDQLEGARGNQRRGGAVAKITKRTVDALAPVEGRQVLLWDDELPGFGIRCLSSGAKSYFLKYRTKSGRQRWLSLGMHGPMTPDRARGAALVKKAEVINGGDPAGELKKKKHENTIAEIADRYLAEHVAAHNKPTTAREVRRIVETKIKPKLGAVKITDLTRADIKAWHQEMRATPYEANRALAYISKMLSLASKEWELRPDNPCTGITRFPERQRERYFSDAELGQLGGALAVAEGECSEPPGFILLVRLLATTGMRLSEVLSLMWSDVDLTRRVIQLRDAKAGARTVYLGAAAVAILDRTAEKGGYVVHGIDPQKPLSYDAVENAWRRLRKRAGIPNGRLHDLRHSVGTFAALTGANAFAVRDLLGHRTLAMTGRYVQRAGDMVRATADAVSDRVLAAFNAGAAPRMQDLQARQAAIKFPHSAIRGQAARSKTTGATRSQRRGT
jgi:integrase